MTSTRASAKSFPESTASTGVAGTTDSDMGQDRPPLHIVTVSPQSTLRVGDVVVYEFVSADRRWRWALGTIAQLTAPAKHKPQQQQQQSNGTPSSASAASTVMTATVRDWGLTHAWSNSRRNSLFFDRRLQVKAPPGRHSTAASDVGATRLSQRSGSNGRVARVPPIFAEDLARAEVLLEMAWDSIAELEPHHWEEVLRLAPGAVPSVVRLAILGMMHLVGVLPFGWPKFTAVHQWEEARHCLIQEEFTAQLAHFAQHTKSSAKSACESCGLHPDDLNERIAFVRDYILKNKDFTYEKAVRQSSLCAKLYRWLEGQVRYMVALQAYENARRELLRRDSVAHVISTAEPHDLVTFTKGRTYTTTVCSSIFAKVVWEEGVFANCAVLTPTEMDDIHKLALSRRSSGRNDGAPLDDHRERATSPIPKPLDMSPLLQLCAAEAAERDRLRQQAQDAIYSMHVIYAGATTRDLRANLKRFKSESHVSKDSFESMRTYQRAIHRLEEKCARTRVYEEELRCRSELYEEHMALCHEYDLQSKTHQYASMVEDLRYALRQRHAVHLQAADTLQTALNDVLEKPQTAPQDLSRMMAAVEIAVDELLDVEDMSGPPVARMPEELRGDLRGRYMAVLGKDSNADRLHSMVASISKADAISDDEDFISTMCEDELRRVAPPRCESSARHEEIVRQEEEIVRLTNMLEREKARRAYAEQRVAELENSSSPGLTTTADDEGSSATVQPLLAVPSENIDFTAKYEEINDTHVRIMRRLELGIDANNAALKMLNQQIAQLKDDRDIAAAASSSSRSAATSPGQFSEEVQLIDRRRAILYKQREAVQMHLEEQDYQLEQLKLVADSTKRLADAARFHDERWEALESPSHHTVTSNHTKVLIVKKGGKYVDVNSAFMREAVVSDLSSAVHLSFKAVKKLKLHNAERELRIDFELSHTEALTEAEINRRLEVFPFRAIAAIYADAQR